MIDVINERPPQWRENSVVKSIVESIVAKKKNGTVSDNEYPSAGDLQNLIIQTDMQEMQIEIYDFQCIKCHELYILCEYSSIPERIYTGFFFTNDEFISYLRKRFLEIEQGKYFFKLESLEECKKLIDILETNN